MMRKTDDDVINDMKNKKNHFDNLVGIPIEDNLDREAGIYILKKVYEVKAPNVESCWDASGNPNVYMNVDEFKNTTGFS